MISDNLTYYISGPMTGIPEFNFPEFERVATALRKQGHKVVSPHEVVFPGPPGGLSREEYLRGDLLAMLAECNAIVLLRGYEDSWGATLEIHVAGQLGFKFFRFDDDEGILVPVPAR